VLDEDHFSQCEWEEFQEDWKNWMLRDVACELSKRCHAASMDRVKDMIRYQSDIALEWWMDNAAYHQEWRSVERISRTQLAALLRKCRAAQREGVQNES
jgi:hypothetical protein